MSKFIIFSTEDGRQVALRIKDIINVAFIPNKRLSVINYAQGTNSFELWTTESVVQILERITDIEENDNYK